MVEVEEPRIACQLPLEVLECIFGYLTAPEAHYGPARVCTSWREAYIQLRRRSGLRPQVLCTCSASNKVEIFNPLDCSHSFTLTPIPHPRHFPKYTSDLSYPWPTAGAVAPDGSVWVSQYRVSGVVGFDWVLDAKGGTKLKYRTVITAPALQAPEGVAFHARTGAMFVASAQGCSISRVVEHPHSTGQVVETRDCVLSNTQGLADGHARVAGQYLCPWNICIGPTGDLFVAVHSPCMDNVPEEQAGDYLKPTYRLVSRPPSRARDRSQEMIEINGQSLVMDNTGLILRFELNQETGAFVGQPTVFCGSGVLNRPSGMDFAEDGSLYVTSYVNVKGQRSVLKFSGAQDPNPGRLLEFDLKGPEKHSPWGLAMSGKGSLYVTSHEYSCIAEYTLHGALLKAWTSPKLSDFHPNFIVVC